MAGFLFVSPHKKHPEMVVVICFFVAASSRNTCAGCADYEFTKGHFYYAEIWISEAHYLSIGFHKFACHFCSEVCLPLH